MKKSKAFWVSRDATGQYELDIDIWKGKAKLRIDGTFAYRGDAMNSYFCSCADGFTRLTGIVIKQGECRKFRLVEVRGK